MSASVIPSLPFYTLTKISSLRKLSQRLIQLIRAKAARIRRRALELDERSLANAAVIRIAV